MNVSNNLNYISNNKKREIMEQQVKEDYQSPMIETIWINLENGFMTGSVVERQTNITEETWEDGNNEESDDIYTDILF